MLSEFIRLTVKVIPMQNSLNHAYASIFFTFCLLTIHYIRPHQETLEAILFAFALHASTTIFYYYLPRDPRDHKPL